MTKLKGHIHHSLVYWCYNVAGDKWDIEKMCQVAKELGCVSIELADPELWPTLKKHGLSCALAPNGMPGAPFMRGFNNPRYQEEVIARTTSMIDDCAAAGWSARLWTWTTGHRAGRLRRRPGSRPIAP